ncbi:MAG TPA: pilus assembly protein PilM [Anaerohalosphaeraceae bacterium]|jgi:Tfp pilus assembly PilM family ATPase/Tfp pilus assembly protein PilN|nr:pilus assembly protein PilM [Anaerohalosphaeraceae bacterium]HRT50697.1 pilus assembly protein PilM [Anaerohalosphaeraceae bacterium]HRT86678.1 pilus assembly protein PilM [Anaerohalosphaeraceae bacterium]
MLNPKIALGIDISEHRISAALLKQTKHGLKLLKAGDAPVPQGAITDGNITNPTLLAAAIRRLLKRLKIGLRHAVVSMVARPMLMQIVNLPEDLPGNMIHFLRGEIRHSPVLAGKDPQLDYCRLHRPGRDGRERVFVGATDRDKINDLLKTLSLAGVEPLAVEMPVMAAARAIYTEKICNRFNANVLVALLHGAEITLCVYRKDELDFVRYVNLSSDANDTDRYIHRCEQEINAVIQYYDIEVSAAHDKWEILAVVENTAVAANDVEFVLQKSFGLDANVCSPAQIFTCTRISKNEKIDACSMAAAGLAMRGLNAGPMDFTVNLIPPEAEEAKANKKFLLVTANLAAIVMLVVFLAAGFVCMRLQETQRTMEQRRQDTPKDSIEELLASQRKVNHEIAYLTDKKTRMGRIFENNRLIKWPDVLDEIRKKVPATLYITRLAAVDTGGLVIEGNALSFKSIHMFAELLENSEYFESAVVAQTQKNPQVNGLVAYSIACTLNTNQ